MNPYNKAAVFVIRLIASGFMLFGLINVAFYLLQTYLDKTDAQLARFILPGLFVLIGLTILIKSSAIATRLTQDFDE